LNPVEAILGPLAGPECRRSASRAWPIWARTAAALPGSMVAAIVVWDWWFGQLTDPAYAPTSSMSIALAIAQGWSVAVALMMAPAALAGSLAGEKERGTLGLLLATEASAAEIVTARVAGKLGPVFLALLAGLPPLALTATLAGFGWATLATLAVVPMAVAVGNGGLAAAASAVSRRGRDALLAVFLLDLLLLLGAGAIAGTPLGDSLPVGLRRAIASINPFDLNPLLRRGELVPAWIAIAAWTSLGVLGIATASLRLRSASLAMADGEAGRKGRRARRRPGIDGERPMRWKELHVERSGALGRAGRWLGGLLVVGLGGGSLVLGGIAAWEMWARPGDPASGDPARSILTQLVGRTGGALAFLIPFAIGLRGATAIASERERETWDALLTSPLTGPEIVGAKLIGVAHALRGPIGAAVLAWVIAMAVNAADLRDVAGWVGWMACAGAFMGAVGVRSSLHATTSARAMSITVGIGLAAHAAVAMLAGLAIVLVVLGTMVFWTWVDPSSAAIPRPPISPPLLWALVSDSLFAAAAVAIAIETRARFDRVAGRA